MTYQPFEARARRIWIAAGILFCALNLPSTADAACSNSAPATGETVNCSGSDTTGVSGAVGVNNVTVNVDAGANVSSTTQGILLRGTGWSIENQGTLHGNAYGILATGGGVGTVTVINSGTISATGNYAIDLGLGGTITNNAGATIQGGTQGIVTFVGLGTVYNYGTINGGTNYGIHYTAGGAIYNYAGGIISSNMNGILLDGSNASTNSITNSGSITGTTGFGAYLSVGGTVTNNASGTISGANGLLISGGTGTVINDGTIAGTSGYGLNINYGGTVINNGTISGANFGSVISLGGGSVSLTNNGTLNGNVMLFNGNDTVTLNAGSTLNGMLDGGGGTNTLTLGSGSAATSTVRGNVTNVQSVLVNAPDTRWIIDNGVAVSGNTEIQAGTLSVNGSLSGTVLVDSAGVLGGNGSVGSTTVNGTLAPGNSIGTITVNGDLNFGSNGTYRVEVSPTSADRTNVTGTAALRGTLEALPTGGTYTVGKSYTVLSATSGVNGTFSVFDILGSFGAGIDAQLRYTANDVLIYLAPGAISPFLPADISSNTRAVATAIDRVLGARNGQDTFLPLYSLSQQQLPLGLATLSGEVSSAASTAATSAIGDTLTRATAWAQAPTEASECLPNGAPARRQRSAHGDCVGRDWALRGAVHGNVRSIEGDGNVGNHKLEQQSYGMSVALENRQSSFGRFGTMLTGYTNESTLSDQLGRDRSDGALLTFYGNYAWDSLYVAAAASGLWQQGSTERQLSLLGVTGSLVGDHTSYGLGGRLEFGMPFAIASGRLAPFAAIQATSLRMPSYSESGGGSAASAYALNFDSRTSNSARSEVGLSSSGALAISERLVMMLNGRLTWTHDLVNDSTYSASFLAIPGSGFSIEGTKANSDSLLASGSLSLPVARNAAISLRGNMQVAGNAWDYAGSLGFRGTW